MASVPKKLFVVFKGFTGAVKNKADRVGFLHGYNPDTATGQKKRETQLKWAYARNDGTVITDGGRWFGLYTKWVYPSAPVMGGGQFPMHPYREEVTEEIPDDIYPEIWDNVPTSGFKILTTVRRYSTNNKLWQVIDPRGGVFEITTKCFEKIVMGTTITKGLIEGEFVWVSNKNLELVK